MFSSYTKRYSLTTYSTTSYLNADGFGVITGANTYYYIADYLTGQLIKYNDQWVYQSFASFSTSISFMTGVGAYLYITFDTQVIKIDQNMATLATFTNNGVYRGIVYSNSVIYVAAYGLSRVDVLNPSSLTLLRSICSGTGNSWYTLAAYGSNLYVASYAMIYVYTNEMYVTQYTSLCNGNNLIGLLADNYGYMALSCVIRGTNPNVFLYSINGSFTSLGISLNSYPLSYQIGVDSKGRFIGVAAQQVNIFY